ncbi:hypothetical protein BK816_06240 [Boudabousia tangfeifanii]|uniref:TNase-like domain-containing protein n=1 Tax=Boudabousia tangfeifanii TaxID=1912795 RepID=A0A1D9ML75_9ACTO|nr:thermonuclease family protein [Boudabousia tangfeifanii]AOZ72939.1 hypothetical protein BK816_06240 [Boudabousia tangfeifanii]
MSSSITTAVSTKVLLGAAAAVVGVSTLGVVGYQIYQSSQEDPYYTVERVIDGDTIDVKQHGKTIRVRLLNIDTPETVKPDTPVQCLGPEASAFLKSQLPPGTQVRLETDQEKYDKYDRLLAGVFVGSTFVNEKIAEAGFAMPIAIGNNTKFYPQIEAAANTAKANNRGLFSETIGCTLPGQLREAVPEAKGSPLDAGSTNAKLSALYFALKVENSLEDASRSLDALSRSGLAVYGRKFSREWARKITGSTLKEVEDIQSQFAREEAEKEAKERAKREAKEKAEREAKEKAEREAREKAEREAKEKAEREAREAEERAKQEEAERIAREREAEAEREREAEAEREREAAREREAQAERDEDEAPRRKSTKKQRSHKRKSHSSDDSDAPAGYYPRHGGPPGYHGPRCFAPGGRYWRPC